MTPRDRYIKHCLANPSRIVAAYRYNNAAVRVSPEYIATIADQDYDAGFEGMAVYQDAWDELHPPRLRDALVGLPQDFLAAAAVLAFVAAITVLGIAFAP